MRSVAQAIPTYSMSAILFPKGLCDQLDASVHRFWWSPKSKAGSYWTPMSWSSLCWPQKEGGLGFRKFWDFNQALLPKLGWWILSEKDCLCIKVLREKYKIRDNWLAHHSPSNASPFWRSMMGIKYLIAKAACLLVGNGDSIRTWSDLWIPDLLSFTPTPKVYANLDIALVVSHLLTPNQSSWDISKLRLLFEEHVVDLIQKIPISSYPMKDSWSWITTNSGLFSIKSTYWLCREGSPSSNLDYIRG